MIRPDQLPHLDDAWDQVIQNLTQAESIFLGFDFDGTLSPIVKDPDRAQLHADICECFETLLASGNVFLAVLSGRSLDDLTARVDIPGLALSGDHGIMIRMPDGAIRKMTDDNPGESVKRLVTEVREKTDHVSGIHIDEKKFSLTVHYRRADEAAGELLQAILTRILSGTGYVLSPGRMCWEIKPEGEWNKGRAFEWIAEQLVGDPEETFLLYIGDDRTDEDVFGKLQDSGVSVLVVSDEKPDPTHAKYRLDSQAEVIAFIKRLTLHLKNCTPITTV